MSEQFNIGPCRLLVSDKIEDPYGSWLDLGKTRGETVIDISPSRIAEGRSDQTGVMPLADATKLIGHGHTVTFGMLDEDIEKLLEVMPYAVKNTDNNLENLGFGTETGILTPIAVALVPTFDFDESDVRPIWRSKFAHWFRKAYFTPTGNVIRHLPEGEDALEAKSFEFQITQADDGASNMGGIGSVFILSDSPISVMGVDNEAQFSVAVPDSQLETEFENDGMSTVQELTENTSAIDYSGTDTTPNTIADATGIEWLVRTEDINLQYNEIETLPSLKNFVSLTNLNLANNSLSADDLDTLINELYEIRSELGANNCVIAIESNSESPSQESIDKIEGNADTRYAGDGLKDAGCTVTY